MPAPLQHAEMLGDVLLRRADQLGQLEHGRLALAQPVEQLDPGRLAERAEALGDQLDQLIGKWVRDGHRGLLATGEGLVGQALTSGVDRVMRVSAGVMVEGDPPPERAPEQAVAGEQDQQHAGDDEEDGEQPEVGQAVDLPVVVDVGLHRRHERLVVGEPGRDLGEDADVLLHRPEQAAEVALHRGQVLQHRRHRRQLRRHQRLHLRRRHVHRLREQRHELRGVGLHAAEALQVAWNLARFWALIIGVTVPSGTNTSL